MISTQDVHYNDDFNQVRLVYAQPFNYAVYGMSWNYSQILVHVRNLGTASARRVFVHCTAGGAWSDFQLTLQGDYGSHSLYGGQIPQNRIRFALRYETSVGTWWDNNRSADYWITPWVVSGSYNPGVVGGGAALVSAQAVKMVFGGGSFGWKIMGQMALDAAVFPTNLVNGGIRIRDQNMGSENWASFYHFNYAYSLTSAPYIKIFSFESDPVGYSPSPYPLDSFLEYVVFAYKNIGDPPVAHIYWDNNFDTNYVTPKIEGIVTR